MCYLFGHELMNWIVVHTSEPLQHLQPIRASSFRKCERPFSRWMVRWSVSTACLRGIFKCQFSAALHLMMINQSSSRYCAPQCIMASAALEKSSTGFLPIGTNLLCVSHPKETPQPLWIDWCRHLHLYVSTPPSRGQRSPFDL